MSETTVFPVLGFSAGLVEDKVGLELECATRPYELKSGRGPSMYFAMTPEAAIEIGRALVERGQVAQRQQGPTH